LFWRNLYLLFPYLARLSIAKGCALEIRGARSQKPEAPTVDSTGRLIDDLVVRARHEEAADGNVSLPVRETTGFCIPLL
jgi:hypothetical protein